MTVVVNKLSDIVLALRIPGVVKVIYQKEKRFR